MSTKDNRRLDKIHFRLHDWYGYIVFLLHVPFHLHHKHPDDDCDIFTLKGAIVCEDSCGYFYDRGYYLMDCKRCYNYADNRLRLMTLQKDSKT